MVGLRAEWLTSDSTEAKVHRASLWQQQAPQARVVWLKLLQRLPIVATREQAFQEVNQYLEKLLNGYIVEMSDFPVWLTGSLVHPLIFDCLLV